MLEIYIVAMRRLKAELISLRLGRSFRIETQVSASPSCFCGCRLYKNLGETHHHCTVRYEDVLKNDLGFVEADQF